MEDNTIPVPADDRAGRTGPAERVGTLRAVGVWRVASAGSGGSGGSDGGSDGGGPDGSDAPGVSDEPIWDDYGGGSPYPPIPDGTEDDGPPDGGELQDPPADAATPDGDGCGDLGSVCHRLVRCCGEAAGTTVCAAAADSGDEHPTTGHCMRTVVG